MIPKLRAQAVLWQEDFSGSNQGWTQNFIDCDATPASFAGIQNGRFEIIDMEGGPCCAVGGANGNVWLTDSINVSSYCEIDISVDYGFTGMLECVPGGPFFTCTNDGNIDNGHDQMVFEYSLDGGPWTQFAYVCGEQTGTAVANNLNVRFLQIRIRAANKAAVEMYWFDNVRVTGAVPAPTVLFSQNPYFGCSEEPIDIFFGANPPNAVINWTNNNTNTGIPAGGTGNISATAPPVTQLESAVLTVNAELNGCVGPDSFLQVLVFPIPSVTNPGDLEFCAGQNIDFEFTGSPNAQFIWTNSNTNIGLPASGTGNLTFTASLKPFVQTATILVVPASFTCLGEAETFTVQINPRPDMAVPPDVVVCAGDSVNQAFVSLPGTAFNWTNNNPNIGLPASGTGDIAFQTALVDSTQVATITVTPELDGCMAQARTFKITVNAQAVLNPVADMNLCGGQVVNIPFAGNGNLDVQWTNSNPNIGLPASGSGPINYTAPNVPATELALITATPTLNGCGGLPIFFEVMLNPAPVAAITGDTAICKGASTTLSASGGGAYQWQGGPASAQYTVSPNATANYTVVVTSGNGCTDQAVQTVVVHPVDTVFVQTGSCNPADTGTAVVVLQNRFGCDSTVTTHTVLYPTDTVLITLSTCNPAGAGSFTKFLTNAFGCDSIVFETVVFDPLDVDSTVIQKTTCDPGMAGTTQQLLVGADNCDSLVITVTTFIPADTTYLQQYDCDPDSAGVAVTNLSNIYGCDSLIIRTTLPAPTDTLLLFDETCDPNEAGVFPTVLTNMFGCDSVVINTIAFNPMLIDTTVIQLGDCDPAAVGTVEQLYVGSDGCDSLVITVTALWPTDTTYLTATTCDTNATGVFTVTLQNQYLCDSAVITTVVYNPALIDTTMLTATSCDPKDVGVAQLVFAGTDGCDSVVITTTTLLPTDTTYLFEENCDPALAGIFYEYLKNQFTCDSVVITTVTYNPDLLDITVQTVTTCDPAQVGTLTELLSGSDGCDSVSVTVTVLEPNGCAITATLIEGAASCPGGLDGSVLVTVLKGLAPFEYQWTDNAGRDGSGFIAQLSTPVLLEGLSAGPFTLTITSSDGTQSVVLTGVVDQPDPLAVSPSITSDYAGFQVSCIDATDGAVTAQASGGTPPYAYLWTGNLNGATQTALGTGAYAVTVTDDNGCTATGDTLALNAPPPPALGWMMLTPGCGDTLFDVQLTPSGGIPPYEILLAGNPATTVLIGLGVGGHLVTVLDSFGCMADTLIDIVAPPLPWITLPGDTLVRLGDTITITAQTNASSWLSLVWTPLPDPACPECLVQTWAPQNAGLYRVVLTDTLGCVAEAQMELSVAKIKDVYVPNVFTPDEDGNEDLLIARAGKGVAMLTEMSIYNRWGNLVYFWNDPVDPNLWPGWDGRDNGKMAQSGVYVYTLRGVRTDGRTFYQTGDITLVYP